MLKTIQRNGATKSPRLRVKGLLIVNHLRTYSTQAPNQPRSQINVFSLHFKKVNNENAISVFCQRRFIVHKIKKISSEGGRNFAQFKVSMYLEFGGETFTIIFLILCTMNLRRQKTEIAFSLLTFLKCKKKVVLVRGLFWAACTVQVHRL